MTEDLRYDVFTDATPFPNTSGTVRLTTASGVVVDVQFGPGLRSRTEALREAEAELLRRMRPGQPEWVTGRVMETDPP